MASKMQFTNQEGGFFKGWPVGAKVPDAGKMPQGMGVARYRRSGEQTIELNGVAVHAIRFKDGREWDVVNGWRA